MSLGAPVPLAGDCCVGVGGRWGQAGGGNAKMVRKQASSSPAQGQVSGILTLLWMSRGSGVPFAVAVGQLASVAGVIAVARVR